MCACEDIRGLRGEDWSQTRLCAVPSPVQLLYGHDLREAMEMTGGGLHVEYTTVGDCSSHTGTRSQ